MHASPAAGLGDDRHVAVVIEPAKPAELAPIVLLTHGLPGEGQVATRAPSETNKRVARELRITEHYRH